MLGTTRIATAPRVANGVTAYRNQAPGYDPRSGEGAWLNGGRFNPPASFLTLYLRETRPCVVAELTRQVTGHVVGVEGLLPRVPYRYELEVHRLLELTDLDTRTHLEITEDELVADDWTMCQRLGSEADAVGAGAHPGYRGRPGRRGSRVGSSTRTPAVRRGQQRMLAERSDPLKGRLLRHWLDGSVAVVFDHRVLTVDVAVARRAAALHVPDPAPFRDALMGATALVHQMTVVTRNVKDFERFDGLEVIDRWRSS